jgi:hypothetical protein
VPLALQVQSREQSNTFFSALFYVLNKTGLAVHGARAPATWTAYYITDIISKADDHTASAGAQLTGHGFLLPSELQPRCSSRTSPFFCTLLLALAVPAPLLATPGGPAADLACSSSAAGPQRGHGHTRSAWSLGSLSSKRQPVQVQAQAQAQAGLRISPNPQAPGNRIAVQPGNRIAVQPGDLLFAGHVYKANLRRLRPTGSGPAPIFMPGYNLCCPCCPMCVVRSRSGSWLDQPTRRERDAASAGAAQTHIPCAASRERALWLHGCSAAQRGPQATSPQATSTQCSASHCACSACYIGAAHPIRTHLRAFPPFPKTL